MIINTATWQCDAILINMLFRTFTMSNIRTGSHAFCTTGKSLLNSFKRLQISSNAQSYFLPTGNTLKKLQIALYRQATVAGDPAFFRRLGAAGWQRRTESDKQAIFNCRSRNRDP